MGLGSAAVVAPPAASGAFSPLSLTPALWIDPSDAASVTISGSSGAYIGANGLVLPGSGSNSATTPNLAAHQITGNIDIRVYATLTDWTPAAANYLLLKYSGAGGTGYGLSVGVSGALRFYYGVAASEKLDVSTAVNTITDGTAYWVRATHDTATGNTNFYTSPDGSSWTQLGATVAGTVGAIGTDTTGIAVGSFAGTATTSGSIQRAQVLSGIGGTKVFDADFEAATDYVSVFTESALGVPVYVSSSTSTSTTASYNYVGPNGLVCSGSDANTQVTYIAAYGITGDIDIYGKAAAVDWTPSTDMCLVSKAQSGSNGWALFVLANGKLRLSFPGVANTDSTVATGFTDGSTNWIRATRNQGTGDVTFYTSSDGSSWTQLGTTVTGVTGAAGAGTQNMRIGYFGSSGNAWLGTIQRVVVKSTIGGSAVFDADFVTAADYATTVIDTSANAATFTVSTTNTPANAAGALVSQINDKSGNNRHLTQGTAANMPKYWNGRNGNNCLVFDGTNDLMKTASAVTNSAPFASLAVVELGASPGANIYVWDSHTTVADVVMSTLTTTSVRVFAGTNLSAVQAVVGRRDIWAAKLDGASSTLRVNGAQVAAGNAGAKVHELLTLGSMADGTGNWWKGTLGEVIFWPSPSSFTAVESYASTKWGTP